MSGVGVAARKIKFAIEKFWEHAIGELAFRKSAFGDLTFGKLGSSHSLKGLVKISVYAA